jgi:hypothetical protein
MKLDEQLSDIPKFVYALFNFIANYIHYNINRLKIN